MLIPVYALNFSGELEGKLCHGNPITSVNQENCQLLEGHPISSVQSLVVSDCDPWTAACQGSLSITKSWSLLKLIAGLLPKSCVAC